MLTTSHQIFSGQFWCLYGQTQFDLTHLLYNINKKVTAFIKEKETREQSSAVIISTEWHNNLYKLSSMYIME